MFAKPSRNLLILPKDQSNSNNYLQQRSYQSKLFNDSQDDYIRYLKSLLPPSVLWQEIQQNSHVLSDYSLSRISKKTINNKNKNSSMTQSINESIFSQSHSYIPNKNHSQPKQIKKRQEHSQISYVSKVNSNKIQQFVLSIIKIISKEKYLQEGVNGYQPILKQIGIDIKNINRCQTQAEKIKAMLSSIDKSIQQQKRKIITHSQKGSFVSSGNKQNHLNSQNQTTNSKSKYQQFLKQQSKKDVDNFSWLQINTKYPTIQKKLKSKLIQSINQDKNEKKIRALLLKKSKNVATSKFYSPALDDEKISIENQSLFLEQFEKAKIEYVWTQNDEQLLNQNIKLLKSKCVNKGQFIKQSGRFKFITEKEFETLASEDIARLLNKNNKIYLSRQFLLDKYYSTTQNLTEQQMRFILKTSPMLSKCVDRGFIKNAIKNINYQNISELELKIADDIISKFSILRNSVKESRKKYKQFSNKLTKQRIAKFEANKQFQIVREIAREELQKHQHNLARIINFQRKRNNQGCLNSPKVSNAKNVKGLSSKATKNIYEPLNKNHVSTGLFVKDCNQQCTDDLFNNYENEYILNKIKSPSDQNQTLVKNSLQNRQNMIKFYTGGPNENIQIDFNETIEDVKNVCDVLKAFFFQKKIQMTLQSLQFNQSASEGNTTCRQQTKPNLTMTEIKGKKTMVLIQEDIQSVARRKLLQNRQKAKDAVYINKLLFLSAQNCLQGLKALNPFYTPQQVNTRDKKGNTALFYAAKNNNEDFVDFVIKFGGNPNIQCQNKNTPLHMAFRTNNLNLILKCLTQSSFHEPNLNLINSCSKTPLAYASRKILLKLGLQQGVTYIDVKTQNPSSLFDNNRLLMRERHDKIKQETLEGSSQIKRNKSTQRRDSQFAKKSSTFISKTVTSIQNL